MKPSLSRRAFATSLATASGAVLAGLRPPSAHAIIKTDARDLIQLNSNENPYGPCPKALAAMTAAHAVAARYPDGAEQELAAALGKHHGVPADRIVLGCGSTEILRMADVAFLAPGRTVVAAEPTFEAVLAFAGLVRAEGIKVSQTPDFKHDLRAMAAACDSRTGLAYVCNPNNPTGTVVGKEALAAFLDAVPKTAVVLVDEAYHHFVEDPSYASCAAWTNQRANLVVARTFSKIHGLAGMRLGYAVCSQETAERMRAQALWSNANAGVLAAGLASLADEAAVAERKRLMNATRHWLAAELARDGRRTIPSQANFLMIHVGSDVTPLIQSFRERGILVGRRFPSMPEWLRISIGTREETAAFLACMRALVPAATRAA